MLSGTGIGTGTGTGHWHRHHHNGRWEARIGRVFGNKYLYLGTYNTQEEAAAAYDMAALEYRGTNAVTNFDISNYIERLKQKGVLFEDHTKERIPDSNEAHQVEAKDDHQVEAEDEHRPQQQQQEQQEQELQQEEADKPKYFQYLQMQQLPLCIDSPTMGGIEPTDSNELAWSFCMDSGLTSFMVPDIPLDRTGELPNLFDHDTGFENYFDSIFDLGPNENEANRECMLDEASCRIKVGMEENNRKERLLPSSSPSDSPYSRTTSVSYNYFV